MSGLTSSQGPYKLVSVNKSSERASRMIGRLIEDMKDKYTIVHSANADTIEGVAPLVIEHKPDLLFCASMWTPAESHTIKKIARGIVPSLRTFAVPTGLKVQNGEDAVVLYVEERLNDIINGDLGLEE